ncbi:MAG: hypothetical protein ABI885_26200, partial [Gammaproteobacteria bacterium]
MIWKAAAAALVAGLSTVAFAAGAATNTATFKAAQLAAKTGATAKLGPVLTALYKAQASSASGSAAAKSRVSVAKISRLQRLLRATDGYVTVDIALTGQAAAARAAFESYGLTNVSTYENHLSGRLPVAQLAAAAGNSSVIAVRPALSTTHAGLTTSQGDKAQRTNEVRRNLG